MLVARCLPWVVAVVASAALVVATGPRGLGLSLDSVVYARTAESVMTHGVLEVPLTRWDVDASHVPLSHFPPLLSFVLAATARALDVDVFTAGRWLNVACIVASVLLVALPLAESPCAVLLVGALLAGPSFLTMHLWLWSEPLFLLLVVASVRLAAAARARESAAAVIALLGVLCGLATLTRYAGVSLAAGHTLVIVASRESLAKKAKHSAVLGAAYLVTVLPWLWFLSTVAGAPRGLGFYTEDLIGAVFVPMARTVVSWFVPPSVPLVPATAIVAALLAALALRARESARAVGTARPGEAARVAAVVLVAHVLFLIAARVFADPALPFDERILSATMVLTTLALAEIVKALTPRNVSLVSAAIVAWLGLVNVASSAPHLVHSLRHGQGYASDTWEKSETLARLRSVTPGVTIFSNAADVIVARLPVAAKYTPARYDATRLMELAERVERAAPSLVVLFDDPHGGWLVPRDRLLDALGTLDKRALSDSVVLSRGPTGIAE